MGVKIKNNAFGVLLIGINTSATSITLQTGQGANFPALSAGDYFYATLIDTSNNLEIVKVTARVGDVLTIVRAQEGTSARSYGVGDRIELRLTAQNILDMLADGSLIGAGTIPASALASGAAVANIGYTPFNANGGYINGNIEVNGRIYLGVTADDAYVERLTSYDGNNKLARVEGLGRFDIRTPAPNNFHGGGMEFGFTSYNLNNSTPYADALHLTSYTDSSGGNPNILLVNKDTNGVKVSRGGWSAYTMLSSTGYASGSVYTLNFTSASDARLKEDICEITDGLAKILALRPVTYKWSDAYILAGFSKNANECNRTSDEDPTIAIPAEKTINVGLIAQEVQQVLPTVVHVDQVRVPGVDADLLNVSYEKLVPHLISAVQEQQVQIETMKAEIAALRAGA
jgi:hypothetical protein